jgi:putative nucleotidyltransferase with HDIG domain
MVAHAVHVAALTILVGNTVNRESFDLLYCHGLGALLHDIGELHLPMQVHTAAVLTDEERRVIERHPDLGMRMVREIGGVPDEVLRIVGEHHERLDGRGYPNGLRGRQIYEGSQLVGVLDIYDAMLSPRTYRQPLPPAEAISAIYRMSYQGMWDEAIASRVVAALGVFPVGTKVLLNTGQQGMVVMVNRDRLRPVIRLLTDRDGEPMTRTKLVDLLHQHEVWIVKLLEDRAASSPAVSSGLPESHAMPWSA